MVYLAQKQILLAVTGGIAAYKSADLTRRLREQGAYVRIIMTENAKQFITPLTMQAVSGYPVHEDLFDPKAEAAMGHIELARWADVVLIAPATADCLARLVHGEANDLLTAVCLATKAPIVLAPAMNQAMWKNQTTQQNVSSLRAKGFHIWGPAEGSQACGDIGPGRLLEPLELVDRLSQHFSSAKLAGHHVVITAGPTREAIDPVRYITNASSGKMGYALAEAASLLGARVTLISGPVHLEKIPRIKTIDVLSADEMLEAVMTHIKDCTIFIGAAAVSDHRPEKVATQKIKKKKMPLTLSLTLNPDIISQVAELPNRPLVIGFAAETENLLSEAKNKLREKKLDMIIANIVSNDQGFNQDENAVTVISKDETIEFSIARKTQLARQLIDYIAGKLC